ncbi:MAG: response regulator receiver [Chitinophagaceae bacterium]|nr:response regulator receiver [Chitinophagaceae bacterium]
MKTIMAIDDDEDFLLTFARLIKSFGYNCYPLANGHNLIGEINQMNPSLIFMDVFLKDQDGRDLCRELHERSRYRYIPIVMMSGLDLADKDLECMPGSLFMRKPFNIPKLKNLISNLVD